MDEKEVSKIVAAALDERFGKQMDDEEKMMNARETRDIAHSNQQFAEQRSEEVAGEFTRLEVQIATILFAFIGFFVSSFTDGKALDIFWAKLTLAFSVAFLILSLVMGMIQLKSVEKFWDEFLNQRFLRFKEWRRATRRTISFEEALAYERGTSLDRGNLVFIPRWPWIMQTIFLGLGVALLFVLFLVYLFMGFSNTSGNTVPSSTSTATVVHR